jgi:ribonuclease P protein component
LSLTPWRFPKNYRLTKAREYQYVFASPYKSASRNITILARSSGRHHPRLGLIVSKKCTRKAVVRNRIKRIIRESFRHQMARLPAVDIVVITRSGLVPEPNQAVSRALERHWAELAQWEGC